jgi:MFS family permease
MLERYAFQWVLRCPLPARPPDLHFLIFLALTREPAVYSKPPVSHRLPALAACNPASDRNFSLYLLSTFVVTLSGMATGFLAVYSVKTWDLSDAQAGGYVIAMQVGLALANLFFGFLSDRKGHKWSLEICALLSIAYLVLAIAARSPLWFYPIFFLRGAVNAGGFLSGISIVYEFTGPENRPTYIGLANTLTGAAGAVAPLVGGWMVGAVSYRSMFILSALFGLAGWVLLRFMVREPRKMNASW